MQFRSLIGSQATEITNVSFYLWEMFLLMLMFNLRISTKIWSHKNLASRELVKILKLTIRKLTRWRWLGGKNITQACRDKEEVGKNEKGCKKKLAF